MPELQELFDLVNARSGSLGDYDAGPVPFVTNAVRFNGVVGFVQPRAKDRVFTGRAIIVSTFAEATVHEPPFLPRGNGGSGLIVLVPKSDELKQSEKLSAYAAWINSSVRWRFSWYRQATADRLRRLAAPPPDELAAVYDPSRFMPCLGARRHKTGLEDIKLKSYELGELFKLEAGPFHEAYELPVGSTPLVSCGDLDNGVIGFVDVREEYTWKETLTIAFNGRPLTTKYHPYPFTAKDDVAVCVPRVQLSVEMLLCIAGLLNRERWRFSYYRKCFREKLDRYRLDLPSADGSPDNEAAKAVAERVPVAEWVTDGYCFEGAGAAAGTRPTL